MSTTDPGPRREPAFNIPRIIVACCALLLGVHALREVLSNESDNALISTFAFLPARVTLALHLVSDNRLARSLQLAAGNNAILREQILSLVSDGTLRPWTIATYALLHASWAHVGFNCVWFVAFGSAVARRFTAPRFLALLLISTVAGAVVQYGSDITSFQLVIGASAAVSGTMGAAVRFVFRPSDEPRRLFDRALLDEPFRQPALTLGQVFTTKVALLFVLFWFATDLVFGLFPALNGTGDAPVAWQAHIGGFLAGLLLFPLLDPRRPCSRDSEDPAIIPEPAPGRDQPAP